MAQASARTVGDFPIPDILLDVCSGIHLMKSATMPVMNKRQLLASLNDVYTRLGNGSHGIGVFAVRAIPKGTDPFKRCDPAGSVIRISKEELAAARAPREVKRMLKDFCALDKGAYHVPDYGIDAIDKSYYLNHSSRPNMTTKDGDTFVALRNIKKGEELTVNYDLYNETRHFARAKE
jgi:SET domain-containing protein